MTINNYKCMYCGSDTYFNGIETKHDPRICMLSQRKEQEERVIKEQEEERAGKDWIDTRTMEVNL